MLKSRHAGLLHRATLGAALALLADGAGRFFFPDLDAGTSTVMRPGTRYRAKRWTCTAIEQRKAAKRRNVKRHKARA